MSNNDSSLCNMMLEQSDLKKLQDLNPFQTEGYDLTSKISIPVRIVYHDQNGNETSDVQQLCLSLLTRWNKTVHFGKNKETQNQLDSVRVYISSEDDIFLSFSCNFSVSSFEAMRVKNQLNLKFNDFPTNFVNIINNCLQRQDIKSVNEAEFRLSYEGTGKLVILQQTQYKKIELLELNFFGTNIQKAHQSIIYRYNYNKTKLNMLNNSIESIYKLLAVKNAPLLAYIQKTVGVQE